MTRFQRIHFIVVLAAWWLGACGAVAQDAAPVQGFGTNPAGTQSAVPAATTNSSGERDGNDRDNRGQRGGRRVGRRNGNGDRDRRANRDDDADVRRPRVLGGRPAGGATASSGFGGAGGSDASLADKTRLWARSKVRELDKNGDMMLDREEQAGLGQSKGADLNGDGMIVVDELFAATMSRSAGSHSFGTTSTVSSSSPVTTSAGAGSTSGDRPGRGSLESAKSKKAVAKSFRFRSVKDRLPAGLPGWFKTKDANGDGQVSMSEYSRSWNDRLAAEFGRYDEDNDGMIAPSEAR